LAGRPSHDSSIEIVPAAIENGRVVFAGLDADTGSAIDGGKLVIFRGAFSTAQMLDLRRLVCLWGDATPAFASERSASVPGLNFHRIDDADHPTSLPHVFHQYGFGTLADLPPQLREPLKSVVEPLIDLENRLAGTNLRAAPEGLRIKVMRHPRGGGHIAPHTHPYWPQKVAIFLNMSVLGTDYFSGDTRFKLGGRWLSAEDVFECGDMLAWRYDLPHCVAPVDPDAALSWKDDDGLWVLAPEMIEAHGRSKVAGTHADPSSAI
jgi:hypothetical protein